MVDEWILFERLSVWKFIILFYFDDKSFELLLSFCYLKVWVIDYTFIKKNWNGIYLYEHESLLT